MWHRPFRGSTSWPRHTIRTGSELHDVLRALIVPFTSEWHNQPSSTKRRNGKTGETPSYSWSLLRRPSHYVRALIEAKFTFIVFPSLHFALFINQAFEQMRRFWFWQKPRESPKIIYTSRVPLTRLSLYAPFLNRFVRVHTRVTPIDLDVVTI